MPIPAVFQEKNKRVLIVDDDDAMAKAIRRVLKRKGYETLIAPDGFSAGAMLGTFIPHVVTLDLSMPGISGREVLKRWVIVSNFFPLSMFLPLFEAIKVISMMLLPLPKRLDAPTLKTFP